MYVDGVGGALGDSRDLDELRTPSHLQVPHETAIYPTGGHASGLGSGSVVTAGGELVNGHPWAERMLAFVRRQVVF